MSLQEKSTSILCQECLSQIETFKQTKNNRDNDSPSCGEIIRRAATGLDADALSVLLYEITRPLAERLCPRDLISQKDDFVQEILLRLLGRFRDSNAPFKAEGFPAYRIYLNVTALTVANSFRRSNAPSVSIDIPGIGLPRIELESPSERNEAALQLLPRITNPTGREIIRRLYIEDESYDEILEALQATNSSLTKKQVYKLAENAMKQLKGSFGVK